MSSCRILRHKGRYVLLSGSEYFPAKKALPGEAPGAIATNDCLGVESHPRNRYVTYEFRRGVAATNYPSSARPLSPEALTHRRARAPPRGSFPRLFSAVREACGQRSSESSPADALTTGVTGTRTPVRTHARWLGAKRGAKSPSLISRVTAKRLKTVGGR
jgi:hypothetical protein